MPATPPIPEPLTQLAQAVEQTAGLEVTCTRDCEVLSEELKAFDGRYPISVSTLRRFFNLIPKQGNFSKTTLNTLARYMGHPSFRAWEARTQRSSGIDTPSLPTTMSAIRITPLQRPASVTNWTPKEAHLQVEQFIDRFSDPQHFHLTIREFEAMKGAVFSIYERGTFDMALWLRFAEHEHLLRFVVEQFPPLDFMASFGQGMMTSFLRVAKTPSDLQYGQDVITSGQIAQDVAWSDHLHPLPSVDALKPGIHPLVQARSLGILLLAGQEGVVLQKNLDETRQLILDGLERETELWPRWANQNCYFAFNLADWAILANDVDVVNAVAKNIEAFQSQQDWYNRDSAMDAILNLRQIWNWIVLDRREDAAMLAQQLDWANIHTMETRTLSLWFHAAMWVLELADKDASLANIRHHASLTKYQGFERRILHLVQRHLPAG